MKEMEVRLKRLETMRVLFTYGFSDTPQGRCSKKMIELTKSNGSIEKNCGARLFGRDVYPTDKPEPHGYEIYLTVPSDVKPVGDLKMSEIPGVLYAVLRFKTCTKIDEAWE